MDQLCTDRDILFETLTKYDTNTKNSGLILYTDWKPTKTSEFWPGWDDRIQRTGGKAKYEIKDIGRYIDCFSTFIALKTV